MLTALVWLSACATPAPQTEPQIVIKTVEVDPHEQALEIARQAHDHAGWGYSEDDKGPGHWGTIDPHYAVCGGGPYQSPIALESVGTSAHAEELTFRYAPTEFHTVNNGHTVQFNCERDADFITLNGHNYKLIQGHFHAPSEHTLDGERFPMALHLVHLDAYDHIAVVGLPIRVGARNEVLAKVFEELPQHKGDQVDHPELRLDLPSLLPESRQFLHYLGSLTTPPCTENVQWLFMETPIELSQDQIDAFVTAVGPSARPIQPDNRRVVTRSGGE